MTFAAAPEYQVFPTRGAAAEAVRGGGAGGGGDAAGGALVRARRRGVGHPHARAGAGRRARGRAGGDARPARPSAPAAGLPAVRDRGAAAADRASGARCGGGPTRWWRAGSSRGGASTTSAARGSGSGRCRGCTPGISRVADAGGDAAAARVPARLAGVAARGRAADVGAAGRAGRRRRRAPARSCWWRRRRRRIPSTGCCARRWPGSRTSRVRVIATYNGREPSPPVAVPANAVLVPWLSYSQTMPACDLVVTHGGHGTLMRALACGCPVVLSPGRRRHGRERGAGRLGGRSACGCRGGSCTPRGVRLAVRRALGRPELRRRRAARRALDRRARRARARAAAEIERWRYASRNALTSSSRSSIALRTFFVALVEQLDLAACPGARRLAVDEDHRARRRRGSRSTG